MATIQIGKSGFPINGTNLYVLGDAADGETGTMAIQLANDASFVGSIVVKGRVKGSGLTFLPIPYVRRNLIATASDDTTVSAALTAAFIIEVNASGLEIALDNTHTSGSGTCYYHLMVG